MAYTTIADSEKLGSLHQTLVEQIDLVSKALENIFTTYNDVLSTQWTGDNFDNFISKVNEKKDSVMKCVDVLNKFADQISDAKVDAIKFNASIASACNGGGASGSGGGCGGGGARAAVK